MSDSKQPRLTPEGAFSDPRERPLRFRAGLGHLARRVPEARFDWSTLIENKNREIERLNGIYDRLLSEAGVEQFVEPLVEIRTIGPGDFSQQPV